MKINLVTGKHLYRYMVYRLHTQKQTHTVESVRYKPTIENNMFWKTNHENVHLF